MDERSKPPQNSQISTIPNIPIVSFRPPLIELILSDAPKKLRIFLINSPIIYRSSIAHNTGTGDEKFDPRKNIAVDIEILGGGRAVGSLRRTRQRGGRK